MQANTLNSGDILDGAGGTNTVVAQLIVPEQVGGGDTVIQPALRNIDMVRIEALGEVSDTVTVDGRDARDVREWRSIESTASLELRGLSPEQVTGLESAAAGVGLTVLFSGATLGAEGGDVATVFLDDVGQGESGGRITVGSTTPDAVFLPERRGVETVRLEIGERDSIVEGVFGTGGRLSRIELADRGATADTLFVFSGTLSDFPDLDASGFGGRFGTDGAPIRFAFSEQDVASTIAGSSGGNVMDVEIAANTGADISLSGGAGADTLNVTGAPGAGHVARLAISSGDGDDVVTVSGLSGGEVFVAAGGGSDRIMLDGLDVGTLQLNTLSGVNAMELEDVTVSDTATFLLGNGEDSVVIRDSDFGTSMSGGLTALVEDGDTDFSLTDVGLGADGMSLSAGSGNDVISLTRVESNGDVTLLTGGGNDTVTVTGGNFDPSSLLTIDTGPEGDGAVTFLADGDNGPGSFGGVTIRGGSGDDSLRLAEVAAIGSLDVDAGDGANSVEIGRPAADVGAPSGTLFTLDGNLTLTGGDGSDSFQVGDVRILGNVSVVSGDGDDTVVLAASEAGVADVSGTVSVDLGAGASRLEMLGISTGGGVTVSAADGGADILVAGLGGSAGPAVFLGDLSVTTGGGADEIMLRDFVLGAGGNLSVRTGAGDDRLTLAESGISGGAIIDMGDGSNTLSLDGLIVNEDIRISGTGAFELRNTVSGGDMAFDMSGDPDADPVSVELLLEAVDVTGQLEILTGGGDDVIRLPGSSWGDLSIDAGAGANRVVIDRDLASSAGNTPGLFTGVETLEIAANTADVTVDMARLNAAAGPDGTIVSTVRIAPGTEDGRLASVDNLRIDLGQEIVLSSGPGVTDIGDVALSTLIEEELDLSTLNVSLEVGDSGALRLGTLSVTDNSPGSSIDILRLDVSGSGSGAVIEALDLPDAELLRIVGDTDLVVHLGAGSLSNRTGAFDLRADTFEGKLTAIVDGSVLGGSATQPDRIEAGSGESDALVLYGALDLTAGAAEGETRIAGFEKILFGVSEGDAIPGRDGLSWFADLAASGVARLDGVAVSEIGIGRLSDDLRLEGLADGVRVAIDTDVVSHDVTLSGVGVLEVRLDGDGAAGWSDGIRTLRAEGFDEVVLIADPQGGPAPFQIVLDAPDAELVRIEGGISGETIELSGPALDTIGALDFSLLDAAFSASFDMLRPDGVEIRVGSGDMALTLPEYIASLPAGFGMDLGTLDDQFDAGFASGAAFENGDEVGLNIVLSNGTILSSPDLTLTGLVSGGSRIDGIDFNGEALREKLSGLDFEQGDYAVDVHITDAGLSISVAGDGLSVFEITEVAFVRNGDPAALDLSEGQSVPSVANLASDAAATIVFTDIDAAAGWTVSNALLEGMEGVDAGNATVFDFTGFGLGAEEFTVTGVGSDAVIAPADPDNGDWSLTLLDISPDLVDPLASTFLTGSGTT